MIYKPDDDTRIVFDEETKTSKVYSLADLNDRLSKIEELKKPLKIVTDEEYLDWAKKNYPSSNNWAEYTKLEQEKDSLEILIKELK